MKGIGVYVMQDERKIGEARKKKIVVGFFVFIGFMWLCTIISKSIYASRLPIVSVEGIEEKYVEHIVEAEGIVIAGDKNPVTALSGLRVDKLMVQVGDRIEEGDVLFTIDMDDLALFIEERETQISKLQLQIHTIMQNEELARQRKALEEERARADYDALARREDTLVGRAAEDVNQAEHDIEDQIDDDEALKDNLQAAAYAEADAKWQRENNMRDAGRRVEDILLPEEEDATLQNYQIELADLQEDLAKYQKIKDQEGQIIAGQSGLVTDVYINVGGRIPDSAVMLIADDAVPCQFKTMIDKEQKKYISINDKVSLKLDGNSRETEVMVNYLAESESMPGNYEIYIDLPEGSGMPGLSGTMKHNEAGEKYPCCVPPIAVHTDNSRRYVYVVKEREGILGMEYYVEEINVKVLDENEYWVAIEGALDGESRIIVSATQEIRNGEIVRLG
ncbi:MAG: biotin/lipoyl-binding protein [Lachnospiraceae bacterium]|nr:biotin/lipoyl-binding protein [Lachnospiraceae bacterium]